MDQSILDDFERQKTLNDVVELHHSGAFKKMMVVAMTHEGKLYQFAFDDESKTPETSSC